MPDMPRPSMSWRSTALGVESESLNSQLAQYFGVKEGVLVRAVIKGSSAEKAGIKAGDVILKIDGTTVTSPREITSVLHGIRGTKRTIPVVVSRERKELTITVTLDEAGNSTPASQRVRARVVLTSSC
jgi:serine protease Do